MVAKHLIRFSPAGMWTGNNIPNKLEVPGVGLPDLGNKNAAYPIKFEFQVTTNNV